MPVEALLEVPFVSLPEISTHKEEFLPGMTVHVAVEESEVSELLPGITWHLVEQRTLPVYDFIMGQWEDEVFRERVPETEGELVMMVLSVNGVLCEVFQRVMHPAHVPLHTETQPSHVSWAGYHRPRG